MKTGRGIVHVIFFAFLRSADAEDFGLRSSS